MSDPIDLAKPHRPIRVGVILVNSQTEILDVAPIDVFSGISKHFVQNFPPHLLTDKMRSEALDVEFHWVNETGEPASMTAGGVIKPTHTFANCPKLDIALMGAHDTGYTMRPAEIAFIRKTHENCSAFLFICGGFLVGLQAGLFTGKTVTAPRPFIDYMRQAHPDVNWVTKRYVNDGKIWTTGTLLNGTDMAKAFVEGIWGGEGTLVEFAMRLGAYPCRDVDYKDVAWDI